MHNRLLSITTDIRIDDGCSICHMVHGSGMTEFVVSDKQQTLGIEIESEALREFLKIAATAVEEMDQRYAQEQAAEPRGSVSSLPAEHGPVEPVPHR